MGQQRDKWARVQQMIQSGAMPPKGRPRPDDTEVQNVLRALEQALAREEANLKPAPGRVTARRLNRAEYNNTVRDLLGVTLRPADDFPQDDSGYGFDNIGDVLSVSPVLMETYLAAAERVARVALFGDERLKPTAVRHRPGDRRIDATTTPLTEYDLTGLTLPNALHVTHKFPVTGEYGIRLVMGGTRPGGSEPLRLNAWVDGKSLPEAQLDLDNAATFTPGRQEFTGNIVETRARVEAGERWLAGSIVRMYEGLPPEYNGPNPSKRTRPTPQEFRLPPDIPPERAEEIRRRVAQRRTETAPINEVRVVAIEIAGPYEQPTGPSPASLQQVYVCGHLNGKHAAAACARRIVAALARRAYRRPVKTTEVDKLVGLVTAARQQGDSFEESLCVALQAMLVSPHFLFRLERDPGVVVAGFTPAVRGNDDKRPAGAKPAATTAHLITQHELASRLSYFLWSSMPDDELLRCADAGALRNPSALAAQLRRMLKDLKSRALVENFGGQWLELRKLESLKPDRQRFPAFDEYLRLSMRRETELFIESVVRDDRSLLDFIDAPYTFVNERLAKYYALPDVKGPEFRRVSLVGNERRGGLVTQASVLTVSSYSTRTSPVLRGKWMLENLLNAPPPPPLPDAPTLDESQIGTTRSLRQQLEQHRANPICASCHIRMDALGFSLENYDAIGGWRELDGKLPIDATGTLPDGRAFKGSVELKQILRADRDAFTRCVAEKLLTYALGRGLERYDQPTVKAIAARVAKQDYRFSSLVLEIVNSMPFQQRANAQGERRS